MVNEKNPYRYDSIFNPTENQRYKCMLPEDHDNFFDQFVCDNS